MKQYKVVHTFQSVVKEPDFSYQTGRFPLMFDNSYNITNSFIPDSSKFKGIKYFNFAEKISEFSKLHSNWDSYNADPISQDAITTALKTLTFLNSKGILSSGITVSVFPMRDGGIQFEFDSGLFCAELEITINGELIFILFDNKDNIVEEKQLFELSELSTLLDELEYV